MGGGGGNLLEKLSFLASKLGNGPLLEHGPLIEILRHFKETKCCGPMHTLVDNVKTVYHHKSQLVKTV